MICNRCPYSLLCLKDELSYYQCGSCDRTIRLIPSSNIYVLELFRYALIRCTPQRRGEVLNPGYVVYCPICCPNDYLGTTIEDLSDL